MKQTNRHLEATSGARRAFLKGAAAAGVAGAAGVAAARTGPETAPPADASGDSRDSRNYRETAHIRAYYRAARF